MSTRHSQKCMDNKLPLVVEVMKKNRRIIYSSPKVMKLRRKTLGFSLGI